MWHHNCGILWRRPWASAAVGKGRHSPSPGFWHLIKLIWVCCGFGRTLCKTHWMWTWCFAVCETRNKSIDSSDQCTDWAWAYSTLPDCYHLWPIWLTARKHLWFSKRYQFHKAIVGRETMITIQKRVFKMTGVEKLLEQNVENRDCMIVQVRRMTILLRKWLKLRIKTWTI